MENMETYTRMLAAMRPVSNSDTVAEGPRSGLGAADLKARLAIVTSRVPLRVSIAGVEQPTSILRIDERLTKGAKRKVKITSPTADYKALSGSLEGPVACEGTGSPRLSTVEGGALHSADTVIDKAEEELLEIDLDVGDQVIVLTEDDQTFYIICKVVDAV